MWSPTISSDDIYNRRALVHSQGDWEEHKYVKKVDDKYYYPNGYDKGRTISDLGESEKKDSNRSEKSTYSKDDSDFDDKNYSDKNRLGDTEFHGFTNKEGRNVIIMEDKKWTLPEGTKLDSKLTKRLEAVSKEIEERRERGEKITADEWNKLVDDAIDGVSDSSKKSGSKKSGSSKKSSSKTKQESDKERRAKNKATIKKRTEEQLEAKRKSMIKNRLNQKEYLNHSDIWSPTISSDELYHHGILGMQWGKRNGPPYPLDSSQKSSSERRYRTDKGYHKNQNKHRGPKPVEKMSNDELKRKVNRKQLEQQYKDLTDKEVSRGKNKVREIIKDYTTVTGVVLTTAKLIELISKHRYASIITKGLRY